MIIELVNVLEQACCQLAPTFTRGLHVHSFTEDVTRDSALGAAREGTKPAARARRETPLQDDRCSNTKQG